MGSLTTQAKSKRDGTASAENAPYKLVRPKKQTVPVIYASPHSGRFYPQPFIDSSQLSATALRRSEDAFIDDIYQSCTNFGSPMLQAVYPRAYVDLNREPYELDPSMFDSPLPTFVNSESPRALAGLGTVARMVNSGSQIYRDKLSFADIDTRIKAVYHPYHRALRELIEQTCETFGRCLLIDCHSMPSGITAPNGLVQNVEADIILGDRFGTSCTNRISDAAQSILQKEGFSVKRNRPYAGGFTTQHYGDPLQNVHVLQIELNRALYMDETEVLPLPQIARIKARISNFIEEINRLAPDLF